MKKFTKLLLIVMLISSLFVLTGCDNEKQQEVKEEKQENYDEVEITEANIQSIIGNHLKWATMVYLGTDYGLDTVFETKDVTGTVNIPDVADYMMVYEIVGLESIQALKDKAATYLSEDAITTLNGSMWGSYTEGLKEYNGKVYLVRGGIGDGPSVDPTAAKILSSENGITKIQLTDICVLGDFPEALITLTVEFENNKYIISDCTIEKLD